MKVLYLNSSYEGDVYLLKHWGKLYRLVEGRFIRVIINKKGDK